MSLKIEGINENGGTGGDEDASSLMAGLWEESEEDAPEGDAWGDERGGEQGDSTDEESDWLTQLSSEQNNKYRVTKMTAGVKNPNRVNVFLDGRFAFSLDVAQVVDLGVKVDQVIDAKRLKELRDASEFGKLYQRTLEWVMTRPHSVRETRDYLKRRKLKRKMLNRQREHEGKRPLAELQDEMMALTVERLIEKGYLDDEKFAAYYIENRYVRRGISHKRLRAELQKKGVDSGVINKFLSQEMRDEDEEIMKVITKKRKKYDDYKLINYLVRQGFDYQRAREAVEGYGHAEE